MTNSPNRMKVQETFQPGIPKFVKERIQVETKDNKWKELKISISYLIIGLAGVYFTIMGLIEWFNWEYIILGQVFSSIRYLLELNNTTKGNK